MFLAGSDGNGMSKCATVVFLLVFSLSHNTCTHTHTITLAVTGLHPPLYSLINGLNRIPTVDLQKGVECALEGGIRGSHDYSVRSLIKNPVSF